jgi:hypothetical protein
MKIAIIYLILLVLLAAVSPSVAQDLLVLPITAGVEGNAAINRPFNRL